MFGPETYGHDARGYWITALSCRVYVDLAEYAHRLVCGALWHLPPGMSPETAAAHHILVEALRDLDEVAG